MTGPTNGRLARTVLGGALTVLFAILSYLAVEVRGQVRELERTVAASDRAVAVLVRDLDYIKTTLIRIENRLERGP